MATAIELYETLDNYILKRGDNTLWCSRINGHLEARPSSEMEKAWNPQTLGCVYGLVGKIRFSPTSHWKLLLVSHCSPVARHPRCNGDIFRISKIATLPLTPSLQRDRDFGIKTFNETQQQNQRRSGKVSSTSQQAFLQTFEMFREKGSDQKVNKEREKIEKRLEEELQRMFNGSESFFFSSTADLTNSLQQQASDAYDKMKPLWQRADERFFWNRPMLDELTTAAERQGDATSSLIHDWIIPVVQGFVQSDVCSLVDPRRSTPDGRAFSSSPKSSPRSSPRSSPKTKRRWTPPVFIESWNSCDLLIISRRSRHRAGTRYKRRGVDQHGHVANYVETELMVIKPPHIASFVQVRGSVPVFWSQPSAKYRPPPMLNGTEEENRAAFAKHFDEQLALYDWVVAVNLVEQSGREKVIGSTYDKQAAVYNNEKLFFVSFDFHEYCKGMRYDRIQILVENLQSIISRMRFCWVNNKGMLSKQTGAFRVNCMDCLDRTNVVQSALARAAFGSILRKLGLLNPDEPLPHMCLSMYQDMWANNGDAISRQYAGTDALKGDYTRTGERRLAGIMRDGMNSASRYYVNRFRDTYRQTVIDAMQESNVGRDFIEVEPEVELETEDEKQWTMQREESLVWLVEHCTKKLVDASELAGSKGWALVVPSTFRADKKGEEEDEDVVLLLTESSFYIARYDESTDDVTEYERLPLDEVKEIVMGGEPCKGGRQCIQFDCGDDTLKTFTTVRAKDQTKEEVLETLQGIADTFTSLQGSQSPVTLTVSKRRVLQTRSGDSKKSRLGRAIQLTQKYLLKESLWKRRKPRLRTVQSAPTIRSRQIVEDVVKDGGRREDETDSRGVLESGDDSDENVIDEVRKRTSVAFQSRLSAIRLSMHGHKRGQTEEQAEGTATVNESMLYVTESGDEVEDDGGMTEFRKRTRAASTAGLVASRLLMTMQQSGIDTTETEGVTEGDVSEVIVDGTKHSPIEQKYVEDTCTKEEEIVETKEEVGKSLFYVRVHEQPNVGVQAPHVYVEDGSPPIPHDENMTRVGAAQAASRLDVQLEVKTSRRMSHTQFFDY